MLCTGPHVLDRTHVGPAADPFRVPSHATSEWLSPRAMIFFCAFAPTVRARAWRAAQATAVPRARLEKRTKILVQASEELGAKADEVAAGVTAAELAVRLR